MDLISMTTLSSTIKIQSQSTFQSYAFILNRQIFLLFEMKTGQIQFSGQTSLVNAFKKTGTQLLVDFDGCADDFPG